MPWGGTAERSAGGRCASARMSAAGDPPCMPRRAFGGGETSTDAAREDHTLPKRRDRPPGRSDPWLRSRRPSKPPPSSFPLEPPLGRNTGLYRRQWLSKSSGSAVPPLGIRMESQSVSEDRSRAAHSAKPNFTSSVSRRERDSRRRRRPQMAAYGGHHEALRILGGVAACARLQWRRLRGERQRAGRVGGPPLRGGTNAHRPPGGGRPARIRVTRLRA